MIAFRRARAAQDNGQPAFKLFCSTEPHGNNTRLKRPPLFQPQTATMRVWTLLMLVCCVCALCPCVRVCVLCAASPLFSFGIFTLLAAAADAAAAAAAAAVSCLYHTVPSSKALYFVAATVQQQSHMKLVSCCDGHGRCICVCACACQVCYRNEGIIISNLRGGQGLSLIHI